MPSPAPDLQQHAPHAPRSHPSKQEVKDAPAHPVFSRDEALIPALDAKIKESKRGLVKKVYIHRWDLGSAIRFPRLYFPVCTLRNPRALLHVCVCLSQRESVNITHNTAQHSTHCAGEDPLAQSADLSRDFSAEYAVESVSLIAVFCFFCQRTKRILAGSGGLGTRNRALTLGTCSRPCQSCSSRPVASLAALSCALFLCIMLEGACFSFPAMAVDPKHTILSWNETMRARCRR